MNSGYSANIFPSSSSPTLYQSHQLPNPSATMYQATPRDMGKPPVRGKTSPYGFFVKMCYEEHKKKYPNENVQVTEISKKCSEKWKTMVDDEKRRFYELAQKDAERYQAEVSVAAYGGEDAMRKRKRAKKDPHAPKRALSAFFFYSQDKRPEIQAGHPDWKVGQVAQELGKMWKLVPQETKDMYEQKAQADKDRYADEMRNYKAEMQKMSGMDHYDDDNIHHVVHVEDINSQNIS
ncbi:High mobility group protein 1.2 [Caenorhabditis elegans]|uniref:Isoform b of High mobility group protein 1.2 n=1 Tax=Caenorhabditis elegans TaxID=6239 RepID=Q09390-2|nr:High mobility group protein 1.2 [Caenorhabditis elegans]CCD83370.1 High mobility group protein 1.2 [Caenorhabditis elegans]|eukprot:NP_001022599.1 High mobility group protein 1.2 [Caenorhabditis elegans]